MFPRLEAPDLDSVVKLLSMTKKIVESSNFLPKTTVSRFLMSKFVYETGSVYFPQSFMLHTLDFQRGLGPPGISSGLKRVPQILDKTFTDLCKLLCNLCAIQYRLVVHEVSA